VLWTAVALLGTASAFIVGFKNVQTYNRSWEARQIWGNIVGYRFFYPENPLT
jgi:putative membrane protein